MTMTQIPTIAQLNRGLHIAEQIAALQAEMAALFQGRAVPSPAPAAPTPHFQKARGRKKRRLSPQALANIRAAQKKRWARFRSGNAGKTVSAAYWKPAPKKKGGLTAEGRRRLAAAMKRRWAEAKKSGGPLPTAKKR